MRIVIDARMLYWTGVGRYIKELLNNLQSIDHKNDYVVLIRGEDWAKWEPTSLNFTKFRASIDPYTVSEQLRLPPLLRKLKPDLVHFTAPNMPLLYFGKYLVTVHDLTLLDYDTSRGAGIKRRIHSYKKLAFRLVFRSAVTRAKAILTDSRYVKGQLVQRFQVPRDRITPITLGANLLLAEPESIDQFKVGRDYILYWGNFYPYKNVSTTIAAVNSLSESRPDLKLVLAGKPDYFRSKLQEQVHDMGLRDRIFFLDYVSDGELVSLCRSAALFVIPSLSEGFGLTGLEAMAQGLPVVAADASCLPEIYGDAAEYFDPHSVSDQASRIDTLLNNKTRRQNLTKLGKERLEHFSWRKAARQTLEAYENFRS